MNLNALPFDSNAIFPHATPGVPGILVMGHLDTVHSIGTELPYRREGNTAWGPDILDMKGGKIDSLAYLGKLMAGLLLALA